MAKFRLGMGHFTALDLTPVGYINVAGLAGCVSVSMLTISPNPQQHLPLVSEGNVDSVKAALASQNLVVGNIECCVLTPHTNVETLRSGLELGRCIGAKGVTAVLFDSDESRVCDNLHRLCSIASECDLRVSLEFMPMSPRWQSLQEANDLIESLNEPNLGLCVDLLHVVRSGGSAKDVAMLAPDLIHYVQLCDGADLAVTRDYAKEASSQRLTPGEGVFPIAELLAVLPKDTLLEIEVPQSSSAEPKDRICAIVSATRQCLNACLSS